MYPTRRYLPFFRNVVKPSLKRTPLPQRRLAAVIAGGKDRLPSVPEVDYVTHAWAFRAEAGRGVAIARGHMGLAGLQPAEQSCMGLRSRIISYGLHRMFLFLEITKNPGKFFRMGYYARS